MGEGTKRVLIVDDQETGRSALRTLLELKGHVVTEAADGRAGLLLALWWQPDVVCLDLLLPVMTGDEVARAIIAAFQGDHRPILIALTGTPPTEQVAKLFDAYVVKPYGTEALEELFGLAAGPRTGRQPSVRPRQPPNVA